MEIAINSEIHFPMVRDVPLVTTNFCLNATTSRPYRFRSVAWKSEWSRYHQFAFASPFRLSGIVRVAKKKSGSRHAENQHLAESEAAAQPQTSDELKPSVTESAAESKSSFAVVGLGASAGGLEAFKQFFTAMPAESGLAFVLIQHLDPTHISLTDELLSKHTKMRVVQVTDEMCVEPNHVYVIPPNRYLAISGEKLHLTEPLERRGLRVPIDFFFRSLADDQQQRAIGIVLSGTGTDGTQGVREIKAAGGMVMAQTGGVVLTALTTLTAAMVTAALLKQVT